MVNASCQAKGHHLEPRSNQFETHRWMKVGAQVDYRVASIFIGRFFGPLPGYPDFLAY
jgi:hypothetical protein